MKLSIENINIEINGNFSTDMSDEEFFHFCTENRDVRIERDHNKQIYIKAPINAEGGKQNGIIMGELYNWNKINKLGICFDSSTGFTLLDKSVLSPDTSWMTLEKWNNIPQNEKQKYSKTCPNFIIELKSQSDNTTQLKNKMLKWIENGCQLAWLIIPEKEETHIYRSNGSIEIVEGFHRKLSGENVLQGFELDVALLK